ncbi:MAG: hypothetical protein IJC15_06425 [Clostridia bacterium]|nr:hypothetical protein [Clostridia bacterium]
MTTQALSNPKTRRGFWNTAAFLGELRRSWANCVLFFLAYFFSLTVPMLNDLSNYRRSDFYSSFTTGPVRDLDYYIPALYVAIAMVAAVWAAITACGYLHKRISVYHFHSMPIRREGMLFVKTAVAFADFLIGLLPNLVLAMIFAAMMRENVGVLLLLALYCLFGFALAYSFTLLCGTVCGTRSFHVIFTGIAAFIGTAVLAAVYLIANSTCNFLEVDYLIEGDLLNFSSPFVYVIFKLEEQGYLSPLAILCLCGLSVLFFAAALLLIRIRPTEGAESPMIFRPVGTVLKYTVMALGTVFFGYFFGEIFGSDDFWMIFGLVCGALLSFMLMNVLIHRNARKMFAGLLGLLVFAFAFTGAFVGIDYWFSYKDIHGFKAEQIESIAIGDHNRRQFTLTSPEVIEAAAAFTDGFFGEVIAAVEENPNNVSPIAQVYSVKSVPADTEEITYVVEDLRVAGIGTRNIYLTQTTKWGASRTWRLRFDQYLSLDGITTDLCRAIADSDEFAEQYIDIVMHPGGELYSMIRNADEGEYWSNMLEDEYVANSPTYRAIEAELREQISFDFFQQRIIGYVGLVIEDARGMNLWFDLPIYESQPVLLAATGSELAPEELIAEEIASRSKENTLVGVHRDPATGKLLDSVVVTGDAVEEIYRYNLNCVNWRDAFFLTRINRSYVFQSPEKGQTVYFIEGKVPQTVTGLFEKN